ncbi:DUF5605 domain-containing protein [Paenibacillus sp. FSL K6-2524]|uniref:DUF5605 domain-containing protein n=1 Tax=Paenibacillus sp. FSL K6-2524 TaxID=2954516 RepID=UPI0030F5289B
MLQSKELDALLTDVEQWGRFELVQIAPEQNNAFGDGLWSATFQNESEFIDVKGFYDGDGTYRLRFMPNRTGEWFYVTHSNVKQLDGITGSFTCVEPSQENHGYVQVKDPGHFCYADGKAYHPFGTTCYAWIHQPEEVRQRTIESLRQAPFNKIRMTVFPKNYSFNATNPVEFPFEGSQEDGFDLTRFNPNFFQRLEGHIDELLSMGIEADLILFHPYDEGRWGFDRMSSEADHNYLRYLIARLSSFRNVWWALANEYDFMNEKKVEDWDALFQTVLTEDPYGHLRSIHNGTKMYEPDSVVLYNHGHDWITHCSIQHWDVTLVREWQKSYGKPIVIDECLYEGNVPFRWGNITAEEMTHRFWEAAVRGGYAGHGETYLHPEGEIWWAKGGKLYGESPERISFLRQIIEQLPEASKPLFTLRQMETIGVEDEIYLGYFGVHRPSYFEAQFNETYSYKVEIIDTWNMSIHPVEGVLRGKSTIQLPAKPGMALRIQKVD